MLTSKHHQFDWDQDSLSCMAVQDSLRFGIRSWYIGAQGFLILLGIPRSSSSGSPGCSHRTGMGAAQHSFRLVVCLHRSLGVSEPFFQAALRVLTIVGPHLGGQVGHPRFASASAEGCVELACEPLLLALQHCGLGVEMNRPTSRVFLAHIFTEMRARGWRDGSTY